MLIWGTKFFGYVDFIDERIHVATRFHHCCLIPLIYQGSYIVIDDTHVLPAPINLKSILFAYLRLALGMLIIAAIFPLILLASDWSWDMERLKIMGGAIGVIVLGSTLSFYSFRCAKANEETKMHILNRIKKEKDKIASIGPIQITMV